MASRAHVIHGYSFPKQSDRPRRQVWYQSDEDPVVLPRSKSEGISFRSVFAALIASALVVGSSYALFSSPTATPMLGETEAAPLSPDWQPNLDIERANVTNELSGPALSVPNTAAVTNAANLEDFETETPIMSPARPDQVTIDDSLQLRTQQPPMTDPTPAPEVRPAPYPNPTTTPPDGIAPEPSPPTTPTPGLDPENPYR